MVIDNKNRDMDYFLLLASADFFQFWPIFSTFLFLLAFALHILSDRHKKFTGVDFVSSLEMEP